MIPSDELTDVILKLVAAGTGVIMALVGALVWMFKKQGSNKAQKDDALVSTLKTMIANAQKATEDHMAMSERHHSERELRSREQFNVQAQWHQAIMGELNRGRDRDHRFSEILQRTSAAVAHAKANDLREFVLIQDAIINGRMPDIMRRFEGDELGPESGGLPQKDRAQSD